MEWTPSQKEAISYKGENILLSAAAGSGKTAVLVQRVIDKILDRENPVSVNELLILTFTEAAASEMKKKISAAINREFLADPTNQHLKNQRILINSANISTIHAFCMEVIKANIHKTDIPVNFSIVSEIENSMMKEKALDAVLARFYESFDYLPSFRKLVMGYGSDKGDQNLRNIIRSVMNFSQSMPHPAKWLNNAVNDYRAENFASSVWHDRLFEYTEKLILRIREIYDEILVIAEASLPEGHPYYAFFTAEREKIVQIFNNIKEKNYEKTRLALSNLTYDRLPTKKISDPSEGLAQDNIKKFRLFAKERVKKLSEFFIADEATVLKQLNETEPLVRTLKNITLITLRLHKRMKRQKDYLDFNDLEHELISLLSDNKGNPTEVALSLRNKYKEILVDEYQDTNYIQDKMFSLISREESNIFTVGDIKQSIYKFRHAVPELFSDKYRRYSKNQGGHLICLSKNFRSRENIIDFTNYVFSRIMNTETGGTPYGEAERLVLGADYLAQDTDNYATEFNIIDGRGHEDYERIEAIAIANRIKSLIEKDNLLIKDEKSGNLRPVRFSDIVILARNTKNLAPVLEEVFEEQGIPVYSESGKSYLTSIEVQTILSYLSIIDNPHQDIPLIAVLRSPIWRFTPDMLAKIRTKQRRGDFFNAMKVSAGNGDLSCARFIEDLEKLRLRAEHLSISDLVLTICTEYNYKEIVMGMSNGKQRAENLRLLFERAAEFDATGNKGLFTFMQYIETILASNKDLTPAKIDGENSDTVKIMTIHKSKGLEFPVVILANAFGEFNTDDTKPPVLRHDKYGFGLKYADTDNRIIYPSIPHKIISSITSEELLAEEMRLLYVALTRAKEKLIISAVVKSRTSAWATPYLAQDRVLDSGIFSARSIGDWISFALARHKDASALQSEQKLAYSLQEQNVPHIKVTFSAFSEEATESEITENTAIEETALSKEELYKKLSGRYSFSESGNIPVKISVSEAKRRQSEEEIYSPHIFTIPTMSAKDADMISATDRGTITHFVLQHINMMNTNSINEINGEIQNMVENGIISEAQSKTVDPKSLFEFFQNPIGLRLKKALKIYKEFSFYSQVGAKEFYSEAMEDEKILLQGTMDCFFEEENGNVVLLDYKTDKIAGDGIISRGKKYLIQLKYYKKGLESIIGKKVDEAYICFLSCNKLISIEELESL